MSDEVCEIDGCNKKIGKGDFFIGTHFFCKEHKDGFGKEGDADAK